MYVYIHIHNRISDQEGTLKILYSAAFEPYSSPWWWRTADEISLLALATLDKRKSPL